MLQVSRVNSTVSSELPPPDPPVTHCMDQGNRVGPHGAVGVVSNHLVGWEGQLLDPKDYSSFYSKLKIPNQESRF